MLGSQSRALVHSDERAILYTSDELRRSGELVNFVQSIALRNQVPCVYKGDAL